MQRLGNMRREPANISGREMSAFGELEGVEGEEVSCGETGAFEGGEEVGVGFCREGGEEGEEVHSFVCVVLRYRGSGGGGGDGREVVDYLIAYLLLITVDA